MERKEKRPRVRREILQQDPEPEKWKLDVLEYETKCRRCGSFEIWYFQTNTPENLSAFMFLINDRITRPTFAECRTCKIKTLQDLTTFTPII